MKPVSEARSVSSFAQSERFIPAAVTWGGTVLAVVLPTAFAIVGVGPVWPGISTVALGSFICGFGAATWAFNVTGWTVSKRPLIISFVVLALALFAYGFLSSRFIVTVAGTRIQIGSELSRAAREFQAHSPQSSEAELLTSFALDADRTWQPESIRSAGYAILISWFVLCGSLAFVSTLISTKLGRAPTILAKEREIQRVSELVELEPERAKPAWDLARLRLELYFDRNLDQSTAIFWMSVFVMLVGFAFVIYGIQRALSGPASNAWVPVISGASGVLTEFLGATFLFLYKSTVQQAADNIRILERINAVGMAVSIVDSISSDSGDLKDRTKAEVVRLLLTMPGGSSEKKV